MDSAQSKIENNENKTAGVILAAGSSSRLGRTKQMLLFHGKTFIENVIDAAIEAELDPIVVVLGADNEKVITALQKYKKRIDVVVNEKWYMGQNTSLRVAISKILSTFSCIFLLTDQPQVPSPLIKALQEKFNSLHSEIIAAYVGERRTNPVLFSCELYKELANISGDQGGRALFDSHKVEKVLWPDDRIMIDVDTEEDYLKLKRAYGDE